MRRLGRLPPTRQETGSISNIRDSDAEAAAGALDEESRWEGMCVACLLCASHCSSLTGKAMLGNIAMQSNVTARSPGVGLVGKEAKAESEPGFVWFSKPYPVPVLLSIQPLPVRSFAKSFNQSGP